MSVANSLLFGPPSAAMSSALVAPSRGVSGSPGSHVGPPTAALVLPILLKPILNQVG